MPTRKIDDNSDLAWMVHPCLDREHNPPSMRVYEAGLWEHTCPSCGKVQLFRVWHTGRL